MTEQAKPCHRECRCKCGWMYSGSHQHHEFVVAKHHPACPNAPKASEAPMACGACMEWDPSCDDCLRASPPLDEPAPAPEPDPLLGIDAQKWAQEFMRIWSGRWAEVDEGLMIGWFANAIMRGYDEGQHRLRKQHGCEIPPLESPKASEAPKVLPPMEGCACCVACRRVHGVECCGCRKALNPKPAPAPVSDKGAEVDFEQADRFHKFYADECDAKGGPFWTGANASRAYLALRARLAAEKARADRAEAERDDTLNAFYRLWDLADATVGGSTSETDFVDGRKRILASMIAARAHKEGGSR